MNTSPWIPGFFVPAGRGRGARRGALLLLVSLAACLSTEDYDREKEDLDGSVVTRAREQNDVEHALYQLSGCNCSASVESKLVRVSVYPGPKGLPDTSLVQRMSERITEITGIASSRHLIISSRGQVLFTGGAAAP
jgi:hypothetical protein